MTHRKRKWATTSAGVILFLTLTDVLLVNAATFSLNYESSRSSWIGTFRGEDFNGDGIIDLSELSSFDVKLSFSIEDEMGNLKPREARRLNLRSLREFQLRFAPNGSPTLKVKADLDDSTTLSIESNQAGIAILQP